MINRHIFVGLSDYGYKKAQDVSVHIENSLFFGISETVFSPEKHHHVFYERKFGDIEFIYKEGREEIQKWNKSDIRFYYSKCLMLSRADFRMLYEFRDFLIQKNAWKDLIYDSEIKVPIENDNIHIIIPYPENSALGIAFFVAWDIKNWYMQHGLNVNIVAHFILPDTPIYNFNSNTELQSDYWNSCSFIKELIAIAQICNGDTSIKEKLGDTPFSLGSRFNIKNDFGNSLKLPFDSLAMIGFNAPIDFTNCELNHKIISELSNEIIEKAIHKKDLLNCHSPTFKEEIYAKYPLFSDNGRATDAYKSFIVKRKYSLNESAHLDYHWDGIL